MVTSHGWRILLAELLDDDIRCSASHQLMLQKCERVAGLPVLVCVHSTTEVTGFPLWSHALRHVNELRRPLIEIYAPFELDTISVSCFPGLLHAPLRVHPCPVVCPAHVLVLRAAGRVSAA